MSKNGPQIVSLNAPVKNASRIAGLGRITSPAEIASLPESIDYRYVLKVGTPRPVIEQAFNQPELDLASFTYNRGPIGFSTSNLTPNMVSCPFLGLAVCITVDADDYAYSLTGQMVPRPPSGTKINTPATYAAAGYDSPNRPAIFVQGFDSWKAKAAMMKAFGLRMVLGCNYELFDMPLSLIGEDSQSDSNGFGTSVIDTQRDILLANQQIADQGSTSLFLPQTAIAPCTVGQAATALPAPTAPVQWGQPRYPGQYQGCFPLPNRMVFVPGLAYNLYLNRIDNAELYFNDFIAALSDTTPESFSDDVNETIAQQTNLCLTRAGVQFTAWTSSLGAGGASVVIGPDTVIAQPGGAPLVRFESTPTGLVPRSVYGGQFLVGAVQTNVGAGELLDPTKVSVVSSEQFIGWANAKKVKHGKLTFIVSIRGFILTLKAALDYYVSYVSNNDRARELYSSGNNALSGAALKAGFRDGLAGVGESMNIEEAKKLIERVRD